MKVDGTEPKDNILLMHGSTYSSHEFDIDYKDYSIPGMEGFFFRSLPNAMSHLLRSVCVSVDKSLEHSQYEDLDIKRD